MTTLTMAQRLDRVNARTAAINPARVLLGLLLFPFMLLGFMAFWTVSGVVWAFGWMKNATVEGWDWAQTHSPQGSAATP